MPGLKAKRGLLAVTRNSLRSVNIPNEMSTCMKEKTDSETILQLFAYTSIASEQEPSGEETGTFEDR